MANYQSLASVVSRNLQQSKVFLRQEDYHGVDTAHDSPLDFSLDFDLAAEHAVSAAPKDCSHLLLNRQLND